MNWSITDQHPSRVQHIHSVLCCRALLPVVVFVFSRKQIDQLADNLSSLDLTSASEKAEIRLNLGTVFTLCDVLQGIAACGGICLQPQAD